MDVDRNQEFFERRIGNLWWHVSDLKIVPYDNIAFTTSSDPFFQCSAIVISFNFFAGFSLEAVAELVVDVLAP